MILSENCYDSAMENDDLKAKYYFLKNKWEEASEILSSGATDLQEFKEIIALGPEIIPYIIADISEKESWIVSALFILTEERPSKPFVPGNIHSIVKAWTLWADEKGRI